jgi:hypothetical protein
MPRMSKNGVDFFDVDETPESIEAAKAKGYKEYIPMTKNGKDVFDVEFSEDSYKAALDKGYKDVDRFKFEGDAAKPGRAESAFRGAVHGLSQSYVDELGGALEAAGASVGVRGVGSPNLTDIRLETDAEDQEPLADTYRNMRDRRRELNEAAHAAHPGFYTAGDLTGSVATGMAVPGASSLKGSTAIGAAQGLGRSGADLTQPDLENYGQAAVDTAFGAGAGVAGYGVGKGIEKGIQYGGQAARTGKEYLKAAGRGAARGAKEATEDMPSMLGVREAAGTVGALKGAFEELKALKGTADEIKGIAAEARDLLAKRGSIRPLQELNVVGAGKKIGDLSDDEAIIGALLDDGDNAVKQWAAQKAAVSNPGQVDAGAYNSLLAMPAAQRNAAREFDPREAAVGLKGNIEGVQDLFKQARDARYGQLQDAARNAFQPSHASKVMTELEDAIVDANRLNSVPGPVRNLLADVYGMVEDGVGTRIQGLTQGKWASATPAEQFNRLQQARQLLDHQIKWANREGHGQGESILRHLRSQFDDALKTSPDKVEADALYRASKDVEAKFFAPTEFRSASGSVDVDEGKIARLLGNTDNAQRFKSAMKDLQEFANHPDLAPEFKAKAQSLISDLEKNIATADSKRAISSFRASQGPSSPAIERMQSVTGKNSLIKDAVQAPAGFLNQADQLVKAVEQKMGKPFANMNAAERQQAVKYWVALKNQENPNQAAIDQFLKSP